MKSYTTALRCVCAAAAVICAARGQTQIDLRTQGKNIDFSFAARTRPIKTGTLLPIACTIGDTYLKTDVAPGKNLYVCTATNAWTVQGVEIPSPAGFAGRVLSTDGTNYFWTGLAGDLSGTPGAVIVSGLGGRKLGSLTPLDGQFLKWNGNTQQWEPTTLAGAISVFGRAGTITAQTGDYSFAQISGSIGTFQLPAAGGDVSGTLTSATVGKLQSRPISATAPLTGQVLSWDGIQWSPQTPSQGSGGAGSAYAVLTTTGSTYSAGAKQTFVTSPSTGGINLAPSSLPTNSAAGDISIDSTDANKLKVYDGAQWSTLVSLNNYVATFGAQTTVFITGTTHRLGTASLIAESYDNSSPAQKVEPDKVVVDPLTFNVTISFSAPQAGSCVITGSSGPGGTGGTGAEMASKLGDLGLVLTSSNVLTAGMNCSSAVPCNSRLGNTVYTVTNGNTLTLTAGTGTLYLYIDPSGVFTAGHNLTLSCAGGCAAVPGISAFPTGSIPLYTWTATNGNWDSNGGIDRRAFLSTRNLGAGAGIVALDTGTQTVVAIDSATIPTYLTSTAVLALASLLPGACAESSFALSGASAGDSVAPGWPAGLEAGLMGMMRISTGNTVAVRICNLSSTTVSPAAAMFRATVVRSF